MHPGLIAGDFTAVTDFNLNHSSAMRWLVLPLFCLYCSVSAAAAEAATRIAVIPVADHSPPSLNSIQVATARIESMLTERGQLRVIDSSSVAASYRRLREQVGHQEIDWRSVADDLELDLVALLSVTDAHVEYLGEQPDHLAVGEVDAEPGTVHLYEGKAAVKLSVIAVDAENIILDEESRGDKAERYRQSHDAAKVREVVNAVRDLAAIFDDSVKPRGTATLTEEYAPLAIGALEKATDRLSKPLKKALPLRGVIILVEGRDVTVDLGAESGLRKGMTFRVFRPGKVVTHPTTGKPISTGDELVGTAKVQSVSANTAVLRAGRKDSKMIEAGFSVIEYD